MKRISTIAVAVLVLSASGAGAARDFSTTGGLYSACQSAQGKGPVSSDEAFCNGFVGGFALGYGIAEVPAMQMIREGKEPPHYPFWCAPDRLTPFQAVAIFRDWAKRNPGKWHKSAAFGVSRALGEAFPCRRVNAPPGLVLDPPKK